MNSEIQAIAQKREIECLVESRALQLRVARLKGWNWLTVFVPALIATIAGAQLANAPSQSWKLILGVAMLIASVLGVIHKTLNCDAYQAEATRVQRSYEALAVRYRMVFDLKPQDSEARLMALDESLAALKESSMVSVPDRCRVRARELISHATHSTKAP